MTTKAQIKYGSIYGPEFAKAYASTLHIAKAIDGATTMRIVRLIREIGNQEKVLMEALDKIIEEYAERDGEGVLIKRDGQYTLSVEGAQRRNEAFLDTFEVEPLPASKIANLHEMEAGNVFWMLEMGLFVDDTELPAEAA